MALSRSLHKGQVPVSCQLCEDSMQIKWKCMDCRLLMCTKCCEKIHPKIKQADKHTILDIKDIAISQPDNKPDFSSINCDIHYGQLCCLYCKECEEVVCPLCIVKTHNKHDMVELREGHDICVKMLETFHRNTIEETMKMAADISKLESIKQEQNSQSEKEKERIFRKEEEVIDDLKLTVKERLAELDKERDNLNQSIENEETNSKEICQDLEFRSEQISSVLKSNNSNEVFKVVKEEIKNRKQTTKSINVVFKPPVFVALEKSSSYFRYIYGSLETMLNVTNIQIQVEKEYSTALEIVGNVTCCSDGFLWLNDHLNKKIKYCNLTSDKKNKTFDFHKLKPGVRNRTFSDFHKLTSDKRDNKTFDIHVYDNKLLPSGDLLMSTGNTYLQLLSSSTQTPQQSCYSVSPLVTVAVHVTKDNKVIVGAKEKGPSFPAGSPRQVIVMDMNGRHEVVFHLNRDNKPIFTLPIRITTDSKNNIYVIDRLSRDGIGRVILLTLSGWVRGVYTGHLSKIEFTPVGIVCTQSDNIIVSDMDNHILHILNTDGQCIKYIDTGKAGIKYPYSLDNDRQREGMLFIGCSTDVKSYNKAKLYIVKVS